MQGFSAVCQGASNMRAEHSIILALLWEASGLFGLYFLSLLRPKTRLSKLKVGLCGLILGPLILIYDLVVWIDSPDEN